ASVRPPAGGDLKPARRAGRAAPHLRRARRVEGRRRLDQLLRAGRRGALSREGSWERPERHGRRRTTDGVVLGLQAAALIVGVTPITRVCQLPEIFVTG